MSLPFQNLLNLDLHSKNIEIREDKGNNKKNRGVQVHNVQITSDNINYLKVIKGKTSNILLLQSNLQALMHFSFQYKPHFKQGLLLVFSQHHCNIRLGPVRHKYIPLILQATFYGSFFLGFLISRLHDLHLVFFHATLNTFLTFRMDCPLLCIFY